MDLFSSPPLSILNNYRQTIYILRQPYFLSHVLASDFTADCQLLTVGIISQREDSSNFEHFCKAWISHAIHIYQFSCHYSRTSAGQSHIPCAIISASLRHSLQVWFFSNIILARWYLKGAWRGITVYIRNIPITWDGWNKF